jgi:acetyltransferase-like isoleucine patch superfamily enzyme
MTHRSGKIRLAALALVALMPSFLKRFCYRWFFGYRIGKGVRIGLSLIDARECEIAEGTTIGHLNVIINVGNLRMGDHVRIGHLNIIRGGDEVNLGRYAEIIRLNEINSIPDPIVVNRTDPRFMLGEGSIVTTNHKIDFTDKVEIGRRSIIGGRNSSLWTHNRQATKPIKIGSLAYIGSEIRMAPGSAVPSYCVVGMGSVITAKHAEEKCLIAGVPAKVVKQLGEEDMLLVERKTRPDLPDDV